MDPITHGITGALLGKAYFTKGETAPAARIAIFAATLGAVFPDIDFVAELLSRDPLAIARFHRGFTHSFIGLPLFAAALAWFTRWWLRRRGQESPSWGLFFGIYAAGIASHILLDAMTTFGTRIWNPISRERVAWDLLVIIDFTFTGIVLLPQVAAWVYRDAAKSAGRAWGMWGVFSLSALAVWKIAQGVGFPFSIWTLPVISTLLAAFFFLPARGGWGFGVLRSSWCRAGVYAAVVYIMACGMTHHAALKRVRAFAAENHIAVERLGALPLPPSLLNWNGLIRSPNGVYEARFDVRDPGPPEFRFAADPPLNRYVEAARELPNVKTYLWFARFPTIQYSRNDDWEIVDFRDLRFLGPRPRRATPFTFRVILNPEGKLIDEGWMGESFILPRQGIRTEHAPSTDQR
jgi:membrane-bound metal-dependent hydrolase YbcI (DUF457 family)